MPGIWSTKELIDGGLKGVSEWRGKLKEIEEDVEGEYGPQLRLTWEDVEIIASEEAVTLENGMYTTWVKQSSKRNSVNGKMIAEWETAAAALKLEGSVNEAFIGQDLIWHRKQVFEGNEEKKMSPGYAPVPKSHGDAPVKKTGTTTKAPAAKAAAPKSAVDAEVQTAVVEAASADGGATKDIIRRALAGGKATLKTKLVSAGGIEKVLAALVKEGTIEENDGTYTVPEL